MTYKFLDWTMEVPVTEEEDTVEKIMVSAVDVGV